MKYVKLLLVVALAGAFSANAMAKPVHHHWHHHWHHHHGHPRHSH